MLIAVIILSFRKASLNSRLASAIMKMATTPFSFKFIEFGEPPLIT